MKRILATIIAIFVCAGFPHAQKATQHPRWVTTWAAPPDSEGPPLATRTVRQIIRVSIGGSSLRLRLSNLFGTAPVTIGPVHVARHATGSSIRPGTDRAVTFGGKPTVAIARGAAALSDPVPFPVAALEELAVSLYVAAGAGPSTIHGTAVQTAYITRTGDATAAAIFPESETDTSRFYLTDVEVTTGAEAGAIVVVGDSITDGIGSTEDANARWPDALAERLQSDPAFSSIAVVNSGISGNRILNDGVDPYIGPSMLSRFDRDVLSKPGVRWVVLLSGSNDISAADRLTSPKDKVSAQQIIGGLKQLIARARKKGVKIWGATLLPYGGAQEPFVTTPEGLAKRRAVNEWVRTSGAFDGVIDFEQAVRDPAQPDRFLPAFDSGDHVHPSDAGYKAMAAAINLRLLISGK